MGVFLWARYACTPHRHAHLRVRWCFVFPSHREDPMPQPTRAVTLPNIGVPHYIGIPHRVSYPYTSHLTPTAPCSDSEHTYTTPYTILWRLSNEGRSVRLTTGNTCGWAWRDLTNRIGPAWTVLDKTHRPATSSYVHSSPCLLLESPHCSRLERHAATQRSTKRFPE